ncbi:hypothetical protein T439DRAFT_284130 [Meredithblackwellia eburnea MCA 4105]
MDSETAALVIKLQLLDLSEIKDNGKGKNSVPSDSDIAFDLYRQELKKYEQVSHDRLLALSGEAAVGRDQELLDMFAALELREKRDHLLAVSLHRGGGSVSRSRGNTACSPSTSKLPATGCSSSARAGIARTTTGTTAATTSNSTTSPSAKGPRVVDCVICGDSLSPPEAIKVPCGHHYCSECLVDLFVGASKDEQLMPPSCDRTPIPLDLVRAHLSTLQLDQFQAKQSEYSVKNRLYCHNPSCSSFLGEARPHSKSAAACGKCKSQTCYACKGPWHGPFSACAGDSDDEAFQALATEHGVQRCPGCRRIVELALGCFHMTCLCKTEFCFLCAKSWKTCECPQWEERRLMAEAERRVQARAEDNPNQEPVPHRIHLQRVQALADTLRTNHACTHVRWNYRGGGGTCDSCGHYLAQFLLRCTGCELLACVRCRRNRL